jgi:TPP-dependent pyruvate/acetoin dehydrogenase alpha subunit
MDLGDLAEPGHCIGPIDIRGVETESLRAYLNSMVLIRMVEQHIAGAKRDGVIGGPVHLGVGQEAVAVGISACLRNTDRVFGGHRSHAHLLALGGDVRKLFAEVLGRDTGLSRGMGGSMHLWDQPHGFYGSAPIVAGTVPLAVGAALAARIQGTDDLGVVYFGDGAAEEGVVHESLNLARIMDLPVLFVVENNLYSSHMHISLRQPSNAIARFAVAHDIPFELVDGNDVVSVRSAAGRLVDRARTGGGPGLVEAVTQRWYGHVDWREDIDVGIKRSAIELAAWRMRDPVARLEAAMRHAGLWQQADQDKMCGALRARIDTAWLQALNDPYPAPEALLARVYSPR